MADRHPSDEDKTPFLFGKPGHILLTITDNQYRLMRGDLNGNVFVRQASSGTPTVTVVASDASASQTILAANTARLSGLILNDSRSRLLLRFGSADASIADFSVRVQPYELFPVPEGVVTEITGRWETVDSGNARVTEFTA